MKTIFYSSQCINTIQVCILNKIINFNYFKFTKKGKFFPKSKDGNLTDNKYRINIPFNTNLFDDNEYVGNNEYLYVFNNIVIPILESYKPEITLVSCGFDGHVKLKFSFN